MSKRAEISRIVGLEQEGTSYKEYVRMIELNPELNWYEELDEKYEERQIGRKNPAVKKYFIFNYLGSQLGPEFHGTFIHENKIWIDIKWESEVGNKIILDFALTLDATLNFLK